MCLHLSMLLVVIDSKNNVNILIMFQFLFFETGFHFIDEAGLELMTVLAQSPDN